MLVVICCYGFQVYVQCVFLAVDVLCRGGFGTFLSKSVRPTLFCRLYYSLFVVLFSFVFTGFVFVLLGWFFVFAVLGYLIDQRGLDRDTLILVFYNIKTIVSQCWDGIGSGDEKWRH